MDNVDKFTLKGGSGKTNWALLALIFLMPLRNIQLQYLPSIGGGGLNVINILLLFSIIHAYSNGKKVTEKTTLNSFLVWYVISSLIALAFGYSYLGDLASRNWNGMKDQLTPILILFLVQRSAVDIIQWRRILCACLISLPYSFKVVWAQYSSVSSWHYSHDLRISGTFMDLGANEMGAYSVTMALICLGCLISCWNYKKYRYIFILLFVCAGLSLLYSYSRGAYVAFLLGTIIIFLKYKNTLKLLIPSLFILSFLLMNLPPSVEERFSSIDAEEGERDESAQSRIEVWEIVLGKFLETPVVGFGYRTAQDPRINPHEMDTHNYYIKMLVERGLIGFITFIVLLIILWKLVSRTLVWDDGDELINGVVLGMCGSIVALLMSNMFGDRFSHYPVMTSFWVFIALISVIDMWRLEKMEPLYDN